MHNGVIVAGTGSISSHWFRALLAEGVPIQALVDPRTELANRRRTEWGLEAPVYADLQQALADQAGAAFLLDLTPPEAHPEVTCAALRAGLHVLGEKPMAADMAAARRMVRTAEESGRLYMVSQTRRWNIFHDRARRTVASGALGSLVDLHCDFFHSPPPPGFRREMEDPLLLDMAIHHFDLARFFTGADPVSVTAHAYHPKGSPLAGDGAVLCLFEMTGGVYFTYRGQWCAPGCETTWNGAWRLVGTEGTLRVEADHTLVGETVARPPAGKPVLHPLEAAATTLEYEHWRGALRAMLRFLETGAAPPTECHVNLLSLAMVHGAIDAARAGRTISIAEVLGNEP